MWTARSGTTSGIWTWAGGSATVIRRKWRRASASSRETPDPRRGSWTDSDAAFLVTRGARQGMDFGPSLRQVASPHFLTAVSRSRPACLRDSWSCGRRGWGFLARGRREMGVEGGGIAWRAVWLSMERVGRTRRGAEGWVDGVASTRPETSLDETGWCVFGALSCVGLAKDRALARGSNSCSADRRVRVVLSSVVWTAWPGLAGQRGGSQWLSTCSATL